MKGSAGGYDGSGIDQKLAFGTEAYADLMNAVQDR